MLSWTVVSCISLWRPEFFFFFFVARLSHELSTSRDSKIVWATWELSVARRPYENAAWGVQTCCANTDGNKWTQQMSLSVQLQQAQKLVHNGERRQRQKSLKGDWSQKFIVGLSPCMSLPSQIIWSPCIAHVGCLICTFVAWAPFGIRKVSGPLLKCLLRYAGVIRLLLLVPSIFYWWYLCRQVFVPCMMEHRQTESDLPWFSYGHWKCMFGGDALSEQYSGTTGGCFPCWHSSLSSLLPEFYYSSF